jgi:hypothetical protein
MYKMVCGYDCADMLRRQPLYISLSILVICVGVTCLLVGVICGVGSGGDNSPLPQLPLASMNEQGQKLLVEDKAPSQYKPVKYEYVMPEEQQRRIVREASKLKIGMTAEEVADLLGLPTYDQWSSQVRLFQIKRERPRGRSLTYYFGMREKNGVNLYDPNIEIFFYDGKLQSVASDIDAIPNLNWKY